MTSLQPFQDALEEGRQTAPAAVGSQVLFMTAFSLVTIMVFNVLRPRNKMVYEPKVKYHVGDKAPPRISDKFCGWLSPLIHTKEAELLDKIGLDAVAFLRFLRLMRGLFGGIAILTCGILLPIDLFWNRAHVHPKKRDVLSMLTIRDVKGNTLYIHVAVSYLITILVIGFVYIHGRAMVKLRNQWFKSPEYIGSFYSRTLSITNVPKRHQTDGGLNIILQTMPYPVTSVHMARTVGDLPELIEYHNQTVRDLEAVLVRYLKGGVAGKGRPYIRLGGCCGLGGVHKDAIEHFTAKLRRTEAAVEEYRAKIDMRKPESYGFASLASVPYAHIAAKTLAGKHPKGATVTLAPNPKDIIWSNMNKSKETRNCRRFIGFGWLSVICFLSLIPLLFVAALANLDGVTATGYLPFLEHWSGHSTATFTIVSGVLPPAVSGLFTLFLPRIFRWLGRYQGALTHAQLDRAVVARYFAFLVISQLVVFTLIGVMFNSVTELIALVGKHASAKAILANLDKLPGRINRTYINQSSYWLKYFPLRGFLVVFDLAQIINLVWISFKTRVFGRTPRDIREWTQPPSFEYAIYYSNLLFMGAVGMMFAPLVPLVALAAAIVFWISSWVYKYQLMFVFVTNVETGGRLWNVIINRVLFSIFLMQCLMILTIGLQLNFRSLKMVVAVPPILMIIIFKIYMDRNFNKNFYYYLPTQEEMQATKVHSGRSDSAKHRIESRFGHPSLHSDLFTPMVHADMMPLLRQVYGGKIEEEKGQRKNASTNVEILDGLRIAAIQQADLQYDPVLYSRDRGELDSDRFSLASTMMLRSPDQYKLQGRAASTLSYGPSYLSDGESVVSPGGNLSTPYTEQHHHPMSPTLSPAPQGYFDPQPHRLSAHIQPGYPGHQSPPSPGPSAQGRPQRLSSSSHSQSVHSRGPSIHGYPQGLSSSPQMQAGHPPPPSMMMNPQRMSTASSLQPGYPPQHSPDSSITHTKRSSAASQIQQRYYATQQEHRPLSQHSSAPSVAGPPQAERYSQYTQPQQPPLHSRASTASMPRSPLIQEEFRHAEPSQPVFRFGAPTDPRPRSEASSRPERYSQYTQPQQPPPLHSQDSTMSMPRSPPLIQEEFRHAEPSQPVFRFGAPTDPGLGSEASSPEYVEQAPIPEQAPEFPEPRPHQ